MRLIIGTIMLAVLLAPQLVAAQSASDQLAKLFEDEWQATLRNSPLFATSVGDRRYNAELPKATVAHFEEEERQTQEFLDRLHKIDRAALSSAEQLNYDIFERLRMDDLGEYKYKTYLMPITNRSGFFVSFPQLPDRVPLNNTEDYENYILRLEQFDTYSSQHIALMREGIKTGYVLPAIVLEGVDDAISPHIVDDPTESLLYKPFESFPEGVPAADREALVKRGTNAITASVVAGYRIFFDFMTTEYLPACRGTIGASELPDGKAFYEHRTRRYTTLEMSPQEVHERGLSEVERIRGEMQEVIEGVGFEGSFEEFVEFLRTDERFYVDTPEQLMKEVAYVLKKMDGAMPMLFKTMPRMPYGIKKIPDFIAPKTTTAYYQRPSGDGTRAGNYFVNTYNLKSRPLYEVEALSLHEAVPGHHHQIALMQELEDTPNFRKYSGFTAFVEGWALYSERLGLEAGFYEDPYSNFGRLTYEMWRACRLVVDPGMHYLGWTRQQAIDFMVANSALTVHNITTEVDRYISWPGQAVAYKTGELKIRELRAMAEESLGDAFDVREFHDVVLLSGAVPLNVLENNVRNWVELELAQAE